MRCDPELRDCKKPFVKGTIFNWFRTLDQIAQDAASIPILLEIRKLAVLVLTTLGTSWQAGHCIQSHLHLTHIKKSIICL